MTAETILARLRSFLLWVAGGMFVGTVIELWLTEHTESLVQLIPFGLCGLGLLMVVLGLSYPRRATLLALRVSMFVIAAGSVFGLYQHLSGNLAFELEIHPGASLAEALPATLSGVAPLLAPGILMLAALLALAATYYHPALSQRSEA
jgi:hypothetical protein